MDTLVACGIPRNLDDFPFVGRFDIVTFDIDHGTVWIRTVKLSRV